MVIGKGKEWPKNQGRVNKLLYVLELLLSLCMMSITSQYLRDPCSVVFSVVLSLSCLSCEKSHFMRSGLLICCIRPDVLALNIAQHHSMSTKTILCNVTWLKREQNLTSSSARNKTWNTYSGSILALFSLQPVKTILVQYLQNIYVFNICYHLPQNSSCDHFALWCKSGTWVWFSVQAILPFCAIGWRSALIYSMIDW